MGQFHNLTVLLVKNQFSRSLKGSQKVRKVVDSVFVSCFHSHSLTKTNKQTIAGVKFGGLVADEMEVRAGLPYVPHMAQLIGLESGPVSEKEVLSKNWDEGQTLANLVTKAFEVFFVSTDGKVCTPVGFAGTRGIAGDEMAKLLEPVMDVFKKNGIEIEWAQVTGLAQT